MLRACFKDKEPAVQFVFSLMVVFSAWLLFQLIAIGTGSWLFDVKFDEIQTVLSDLNSEKAIAYQKYLQSVISIGMFIIAPLLTSYFLYENIWDFLEMKHHPGIVVIFLVCILMVLALPMNNFFTSINGQLDTSGISESLQNYFEDKESQAEKLFENFLGVTGIVPLLINLLIIAVIPGIGEELLFRGVLQKILIRWTKNTFAGVLITSLAFALLHFQFLSVLPRFVLGMILGYLFVWTRSLWMPILAHFINNALAVLYYYLFYNGMTGTGMENIGTPEYFPLYGMVSILSTGVILWFIQGIMRKKINQTQHVKS